MIVADSWYSSLDNLKSIRSHDWEWVMGLKNQVHTTSSGGMRKAL
jgi:hypothetical protein